MGFDDDDHPYYFHRKNKYDLNSKIMIISIISLSIVVLFVTLLHLYARCVLRRQARRRPELIQRVTIIRTDAQVEPPKRGLEATIIASLPVFTFKKNKNSIECTICLNVFERGDRARTLPNCKHVFHAECIDRWFESHSTCPICRTKVEPRLLPVPREGVVGGSDCGLSKISGSSSRLSSFRRMLSRDKSSIRIPVQSSGVQDGVNDLERQ